MTMLITEERFNKYKNYLDREEDILIYAEKKDGEFHSSIFGDLFHVIVGLTCIVEQLSQRSGMSVDMILGGIREALKNYETNQNQGGDR